MGDSNDLRFDGRVVIVTGSGNGLGKAYALAFAERGASVVVNDLGGDMKGGGKSSKAADEVVNMIRSKGGKAVANYDSVEDGDAVVQTALDNFGRVDVVVNNAGILRDRSFARTSDQDWDLIHRVHLRGSFKVSRAAWPHMRKQKYGRIIMTSSAAGIYGNFGQANYSAAKLGLYGLSNTLAIEGEKNNIHCNTIAPTAGSRLTETVLPPDLVAALKPEYLCPLVLYLCHESCDQNGSIYEAAAGWYAALRWQRSSGVMIKRNVDDLTPEIIRDNWDKINSFEKVTHPTKITDTMEYLMQVLQETSEDPPKNARFGRTPLGNNNTPVRSAGVKPEDAIGSKFPDMHYSYNERDVMLYALGVGVSTRQPDYLKFLFEYSDNFCVLPTFGVIMAFGALESLAQINIPGMEVNPAMILHGEQYLEVLRPIPRSGDLINKAYIADILDKGRGAAIVINVDTFDREGNKITFNQTTVFLQGAGGYGGKRKSNVAIETLPAPKRDPDFSTREKTSIDQAALYRLSGDRNPLHIDPSFSAMGGFPTPILHGLCSFGYSVRHVLKAFCDNDVTKFKDVKVRFSAPVIPGETLQTDMWQEGQRIHFTTKVVETGKICLSGGYVDLHSVQNQESTLKPVSKSDKLFQDISKRVAERPELTKINAVYLFKITEDGGDATEWTIDLKGKAGSVYPGTPKSGKADCTITLSSDTFVEMASGKLSGQKAFFTGKLKLAGNMMLSQKLGQLFQEQSKL